MSSFYKIFILYVLLPDDLVRSQHNQWNITIIMLSTTRQPLKHYIYPKPIISIVIYYYLLVGIPLQII